MKNNFCVLIDKMTTLKVSIKAINHQWHKVNKLVNKNKHPSFIRPSTRIKSIFLYDDCS